MTAAIRIQGLSKQYRLGQVGTGTLSHDLNRWWARVRGKEDPYSQVGQVNQREQEAKGDYVWALKDINLEVAEGEVLGIIGANGAGKSTLLKLISRITAPTSGSIKARGRIASLLEVGTGMHPEMTARENIYLNGAILGMRRHEISRKFDDIIDFAGCRMFVDTPVKRFSSGMKVRLGFAVAAFLEPEILIVDEVLAVGDADFQDRALGKMKEIGSDSGRTVLFVSHNMESVTRICKSAVMVEHGRIGPAGTASAVVQSYLTRVARAEPGKRRGGSGACEDLRLLVNGKDATRHPVWNVDEGLTLECQLDFQTEVRCPRLDLSFYRADGVRLLTLMTDRVLRDTPQDYRRNWTIQVHVPEAGIHACEGYLDIGVSEDGTRRYSMIFKNAWAFSVMSDQIRGHLPVSIVGLRAVVDVIE